MGEEVPEWQMMWGAKVKTPIDMPDDILKDAITTVIQELSSSSSNSTMSYESEEKGEKEEKEKEGRGNTKDTSSTKNRRASLLSPNINNNEHQQVLDNTNTNANNNTNMGTVTDEMVKKIKNHMDSKWSPTWHVVIGRNFGSLVTHETKSFIYFYYENQAVMMFKAG